MINYSDNLYSKGNRDVRRRCSLNVDDIDEIYDYWNQNVFDDRIITDYENLEDLFHDSGDSYLDEIFTLSNNATLSLRMPKIDADYLYNSDKPAAKYGAIGRRCSLICVEHEHATIADSDNNWCRGVTDDTITDLFDNDIDNDNGHHFKYSNETSMGKDQTLSLTVCDIDTYSYNEGGRRFNELLANFTPEEVISADMQLPTEKELSCTTAPIIDPPPPFFTGNLANYHSVVKTNLLEAIEKTMTTRLVVNTIKENFIKNLPKQPRKYLKRKAIKRSNPSKYVYRS